MDIQKIKREDLHVGDSVYLDSLNQEGTVLSIDGDKAKINFPGSSGYMVIVNSDGFWQPEEGSDFLKWGRYPSITTPELVYNGSWDTFEDKDDEVWYSKYQEDGSDDGLGVKLDKTIHNNFVYGEMGQPLSLYSFDGFVEGNIVIMSDKKFCKPMSEMRIFKSKEHAEMYLEAIKDIEKVREEENKRRAEVAGVKHGDFVQILIKDFMSISPCPNKSLRDKLNAKDSYADSFIVENLGSISDTWVYLNLKDLSGTVPSKFVKKITKDEYEENKKNVVYKRIAASMIVKMKESLEKNKLTTSQMWTDLLQRLRADSTMGRKLMKAADDPTEIIKTVISNLQSNLDMLKKDVRVKSIVFDEVEFNLEIETADMYIKKVVSVDDEDEDITSEYFDEPLKIGRYKISIDLIKNTVDAKRMSKIKTLSGTHPHIDGGICWGNMGEAVAKAHKTMDIHTIVNILLEIIENVREGDTYIDLNHFYQSNKEA